MTDSQKEYFSARGRRKSAHAFVRLTPGSGAIVINKIESNDQHIIDPLTLIGETDKWDIMVSVHGGGFNSQTDAIKLAVARALIKHNSEFKTTLRKAGFISRDSREKERKKPGLKRARRAPQWSKR